MIQLVTLLGALVTRPIGPLHVRQGVAPPPLCMSLAEELEALERSVGDLGSELDEIIDGCLNVCRALPGARGEAALPDGAHQLREVASGFAWQAGNQLKQHLFDAQLWDDVLESLALAIAETEGAAARARATEAAESVAASVRFVQLPEPRRRDALDALAAAVAADDFASARAAALAAAKAPRAKAASAADAYADARRRRRGLDFVAVPPAAADDERIIRALYSCAVEHLGGSVLQPLGFPRSELGLRSLVAADRATGSQRAAAAIGRAWHAANELGPLIVHPRLPAAALGGRTLVVVFSSLGWNGVVRAEWGATLRTTGDDAVVVAHALDTAQSWFMTDPTTGDFDEGGWWDRRLEELCAPYKRVCVLGESMGASAALRFAKHATGSVVALVPQIDVRDFETSYAGRADFSDARKARLREEIVRACDETGAQIVLHVGRDPPDLRQLDYLPPPDGQRLRVVKHTLEGHALGAGLKAKGLLRKVVLRDLLGHTYRLPAAPPSPPSAAGTDESRAGGDVLCESPVECGAT